MKVNVDGVLQSDVTYPDGGTRASADVRFVIYFTLPSPTISGQMNNFSADEDHLLRVVMTFLPSTLTRLDGNEFDYDP